MDVRRSEDAGVWSNIEMPSWNLKQARGHWEQEEETAGTSGRICLDEHFSVAERNLKRSEPYI
jgi:hypothetical protein